MDEKVQEWANKLNDDWANLSNAHRMILYSELEVDDIPTFAAKLENALQEAFPHSDIEIRRAADNLSISKT